MPKPCLTAKQRHVLGTKMSDRNVFPRAVLPRALRSRSQPPADKNVSKSDDPSRPQSPIRNKNDGIRAGSISQEVRAAGLSSSECNFRSRSLTRDVRPAAAVSNNIFDFRPKSRDASHVIQQTTCDKQPQQQRDKQQTKIDGSAVRYRTEGD